MKKTDKRPLTIKRVSFLLVFLAALLLTTAYAAGNQPAGAAVDPVDRSDNYSAVLYDNSNGLPTSEANDIAQTSEGFIWIGSYSGLVRYDGNTFERIDSTTGITSVVCLLVDSRDRLWIGTNDNGLAMLERGEFTIWKEADGLGSTKICCLEEDSDGSIYVGTTAGISVVSPDLTLSRLDDPRIANLYMEHITRGSDGLLYCITNEDDCFTLRGGELEYYTAHTMTAIDGITSILPDPDAPGMVHIGTGESMIYYGDPKTDPGAMKSVDISPLFSVISMKQIDGKLWICCRNGIGMIDDEGFHHLSELPMNNSVNQVMADYEGNLWFVSARQGVMKVVANSFLDVFEQYGLDERVVNSTCIYEGRLYVATDTGLIVLDEEGPLSALPLASARTASGKELESADLLQLLDGVRLRSVVRDSQGRLWISSWRGYGALCYDGNEVTAFTEEEGLFSDHVRIVHETNDGSLLVVNTGGLNVIRDDRIVAGYGREDGIENPETLTVAEAPNGDYVIGSNGDGIYVINDEGLRRIGTEDGLSSGIVMRVKYDPDHNVFWLVTSNSISYMTEDYRITTVQNFPYSNNFDLYENSKGDMWILSSNGIYVVPADELLANGEIRPVHYSIANGLPYITTSNSYSELTEEGDLYIAGNSGVTKVNIEAPLEEISDIKQAVPYVEADGERLWPDESGGFTLPAKVQKLTVYAYVFNYSLTDPQVSYQLKPFDKQAVTVSRSELDPITYTNLPGGSYEFVMELKDAMGRGGKTLTVPIVKEKALHEQVWFYCLVATLAAMLLTLLFRGYVRRKMRSMEKQHKAETERERIAAELDMAAKIQEGMLPHVFPPFPDRKEFDLYASMKPALAVGGDFYDFFLIDDDHLALVIADVSGKGIPAALFMMVSKALLKNTAKLGKSVEETLTSVNDTICSNNKMQMFVTVWMGILEISSGRIRAANAGHEYPAVMKNGRFELLKDKHGFIIGGMDGVRYKEYELQLTPGDKIFVYTDGVPEATSAAKELFGTDRMIDALNRDPAASPEELLANVGQAVDGFVMNAEQFDDLTMLCLEYKGSAPEQADP